MGSSPSPLTILPRSRHLPVAVTEGSLTENLNEIGVRLWTDRSVASFALEATQTTFARV